MTNDKPDLLILVNSAISALDHMRRLIVASPACRFDAEIIFIRRADREIDQALGSVEAGLPIEIKRALLPHDIPIGSDTREFVCANCGMPPELHSAESWAACLIEVRSAETTQNALWHDPTLASIQVGGEVTEVGAGYVKFTLDGQDDYAFRATRDQEIEWAQLLYRRATVTIALAPELPLSRVEPEPEPVPAPDLSPVELLIVDWLTSSFWKDTGIDVRNDSLVLERLRAAAAEAVGDLQSRDEAKINLPFLTSDGTGPRHLNVMLTRAAVAHLREHAGGGPNE